MADDAATDGPGHGTNIVAGAVLAAGRSRRMGQVKALIAIGGKTMLQRAVDTLFLGGCRPVGVVTGHQSAQVSAAVPNQASVVHNQKWESGMGSSVAMALGWAASGPADAVVLVPVDTPGIRPDTVHRLITRWRDAGGSPDAAMVATYQDRPRHPVLFGRAHWTDIATTLQGDSGARRWLAAHPQLVTRVACEDIADPTDLDTPQDLARWTRQASSPAR